VAEEGINLQDKSITAKKVLLMRFEATICIKVPNDWKVKIMC